MIQRRYPRTHIGDPRKVDVGETDTLPLGHVEQHLPPRIYNQRMPVRLPTVLVAPELSRGDHEQPGLDCARAEQDVPVRAARRHGEGRGHRDYVGVGLGESREQGGKAQIVADGQAELSDRRAVDDGDIVPGRIGRGLAPRQKKPARPSQPNCSLPLIMGTASLKPRECK